MNEPITAERLDEIERLAKACREVEGDDWWEPDSFALQMPEPDRVFIAALSPEKVTAIVSLARKGLTRWNSEGPHCPTCDCGEKA